MCANKCQMAPITARFQSFSARRCFSRERDGVKDVEKCPCNVANMSPASRKWCPPGRAGLGTATTEPFPSCFLPQKQEKCEGAMTQLVKIACLVSERQKQLSCRFPGSDKIPRPRFQTFNASVRPHGLQEKKKKNYEPASDLNVTRQGRFSDCYCTCAVRVPDAAAAIFV